MVYPYDFFGLYQCIYTEKSIPEYPLGPIFDPKGVADYSANRENRLTVIYTPLCGPQVIHYDYFGLYWSIQHKNGTGAVPGSPILTPKGW